MSVDEQQDKRQELIWKVFLWGLAMLSGILLFQQRLNSAKLGDVNHRVIAIESSRCSAVDCNNIRSAVSSLEQAFTYLPKEIPPKWFLDKVNRLELKVEQLERTQWQKAPLSVPLQRGASKGD